MFPLILPKDAVPNYAVPLNGLERQFRYFSSDPITFCNPQDGAIYDRQIFPILSGHEPDTVHSTIRGFQASWAISAWSSREA